MRYAVLGMLILFALGDGCSPQSAVVGVQDYGRVVGRVLDATTNRPIPNALISVGSLYATNADVTGAFSLRTIAGDQTVTARAPGYTTSSADATITKDATVSVGYIRLVPLTAPAGLPTLQPPPTPSPKPSPSPAATQAPGTSPAPSPAATSAPSQTPSAAGSPSPAAPSASPVTSN